MNDGDGKYSVKFSSERDYQKSNKKSSRIDDFPQAIARISMAQVCEGLGFQSFQQSALDTLTNVAIRYIREIGRISSLRANLANRRECNVFDLIQGLEDLGSVQGFSGALDVSNCLSESGVVREIIRYVGEVEEIQFAYSVPGFPAIKERKLNPSFAQSEESPPDEHIPSWLPRFPGLETYTESNIQNNKDSDALADEKFQQPELQHRQVERPPLNLYQSSICNGSEVGVAAKQGGATSSHRAAEINPYLAPPLHFGDKEVHVHVLPTKFFDEATSHLQSHEVTENHVSALEPLLPENDPCDRRKILLNGRPNVHFKLENGKKSSGMRRGTQNEGVERISIWFTDDHGGNDEIKREAEQILRQGMDFSQEVSHL